ncbi:hypothetical protein HUT18_32910 [Streptomyces sp. NA04227]|uniref:hypothetical protein n=1 Tax=Streptomyces sp. NA04227 TaxID=2742136 RepID=UPI0015910751|nr:hypothetical protein [Streptomyces sp. NA04227]QKW10509.1 hypothetical protein HUT18_32910 [Streptomyces sp. NA04227]
MFRRTTRVRRTTPTVTAAVLALAAAAALPAAAADARPERPSPAPRYTVQEIHTFLESFYGEHGPGTFARKYGISPALATKVRRTPGYDLLLCAQDRPGSIDIGRVTIAPATGTGRAVVTTHWGKSGQNRARLTAYVDRDARRPLQLHDVVCGF